MIPEEKQIIVAQALQSAFGVKDYEDIHRLTGGMSPALVYKIVVRNTPYLLRIMRSELISNPANEFANMQIAAQAGIAPRIWYSNVDERVLITDFVETKPYPQDPAPQIALMIRKLHTLQNFTKTGNYFDVIDRFILRFQAARLLPESETEELFRRYADVQRVYPRNDPHLVASHNDLKPQNMLFDGDRFWLVDWESAFLNDPYVDLTVVANFFVHDDAQEDRFLEAYFGKPASEDQRARFFLARQAVSIFYTTVFLLGAARQGQAIDTSRRAIDFREYHEGLISGKTDMLTAEAKAEYGLLHLRQALQNMRSERFAAAVARVSAASAAD